MGTRTRESAVDLRHGFLARLQNWRHNFASCCRFNGIVLKPKHYGEISAEEFRQKLAGRQVKIHFLEVVISVAWEVLKLYIKILGGVNQRVSVGISIYYLHSLKLNFNSWTLPRPPPYFTCSMFHTVSSRDLGMRLGLQRECWEGKLIMIELMNSLFNIYQ